jgi:hypothetical protein
MFASNLISAAAIALLGVSVAIAAPVITHTRSITSNQVHGLATQGDTLMMSTAAGLNTAILQGDSLPWHGLEIPSASQLGLISIGGNRAAVAVQLYKGATKGLEPLNPLHEIHFYDFSTNGSIFEQLPFSLLSYEEDTVFVNDQLHRGGSFWFACAEAGLLNWNPGSVQPTVFVPSLNKAAFAAEQFKGISDTLRTSNKALFRPIAVEILRDSTADSSLLVATPSALWRFSPKDTTWDSLATRMADSRRSFDAFVNIFVNNFTTPPTIFATIRTKGLAKDEAELFRYDTLQRSWHYVTGRNRIGTISFKTPQLCLPAADTLLYVSDGNALVLLDIGDTTSDTISTAYKSRMEAGGEEEVDNILGLDISDIALSPAPDGGSWNLWIATPEGLFYGLGENVSSTAALKLQRRQLAIKGGLKEVFAMPGILNDAQAATSSRPPEVLFSYNLSSAAQVTIEVFDYNMDLVRTVIRKQRREAGSERSSHISTVPGEDRWDGTNQDGRVVAPGVYYFKITTSTGERAFGKIVVALQR